MNSLACFVLFALTAHAPLAGVTPAPVQQQQEAQVALAPDGVRGYGADLTQRDIDKLARSRAESDRVFLDGLTEVSTEVRVAVLGARRQYSELGYFKLIAGSAGDDLALLHATYVECLGEPARHLAPGDARAKVLAAMLLDTRFNVRRGLLEQAEASLRELDRVRAVFHATVVGYTSLLDAERKNVAARGDLAAAELRALRSDLHILQPMEEVPSDGASAALELHARLLWTARANERAAAGKMLDALLQPRRDIEQRMRAALLSTRNEPKLRGLRQWRAQVNAEGADLRTQVFALLPDVPQGWSPGGEFAKLGKSQRFREAAARAVKGLLSDPLDPDLAWAAGHARAFSSPGFDEIIYMDRFLALRGLRYSDANPGAGRQLTGREIEAFSVIARYAIK